VASLPLISCPSSQALAGRAATLRNQSVRALFDADPERRPRSYHRTGCELELDFSRQLIDDDTLSLLLQLATEACLPSAMTRLLGGEAVNVTERRPALHSALRAPAGNNPEVDAVRDRMRHWSRRLRAGAQLGFRDEAIRDVVNIGIGGSDLGPRLIAEALGDDAGAVRCHFVANVDPEDLRACLAQLDPARTLFIVCSKSFKTEETRVNAEAARHWLRAAGASDASIARHFLAVSSNLGAAADFGIPADQCLPMWDWVGGRYSLWSAVGLSAAIALGWEAFEGLLAGAAAMDRHALETPPADNLAMLSALIDCWNSHFLGAGTLAVLPYSQRLRKLPDYLQQLVMESNGKRVALDGKPLPYHSAPILWGAAGTIGQHSFHQLLHQGTRLTALELVLPLSNPAAPAQHDRLVAHCLAQSAVFTSGRSAEDAREALLERGEPADTATALAPHLAMPGNRPHSLITFRQLNPEVLGALLALWEHRTYLNACLLGLNAFDQWGVELGKVVSGAIQEAMSLQTSLQESSRKAVPEAGQKAAPEKSPLLDTGTQRLLARWREAQTD
jgi:glucose-6-phosphate isomerase